MNITQTQLDVWLLQYFLPFVRIAALMMVAPVFGARAVPARIRLVLALLLTVIVAPLLPAPQPMALFGALWWMTILQQMAIGVAMGFVLQIAFEGVMMGGELIAYSMSLSFAQMADPLRGSSSPVISQFLMTMAMLLFLSMNGHLLTLELLADSFRTLPLDADALSGERFRTLALFGGQIFSGGLRIALPVMIALLTVNLAFGVMSRAAPSLNLMSVGFPAALLAGLLLLQFSLPGLRVGFEALLRDAWALLDALIGGSHV